MPQGDKLDLFMGRMLDHVTDFQCETASWAKGDDFTVAEWLCSLVGAFGFETGRNASALNPDKPNTFPRLFEKAFYKGLEEAKTTKE